MKMLHKNCGGEIKEDPDSPPYHYDCEKDTSNPNDPKISVYRCEKCNDEIVGDAQIVFEGDDAPIPF